MGNDKTLRAVHVGLSVGHAGRLDTSDDETLGARARLLTDVRRLPGVEVVAYCELYDSSKLDEVRTHFPGAGAYDNVDDLIANEEFDLACVVLQPRDMPDTLLKLANAGKHLLADKQFALHGDDLKPVVEAVNRNNLTSFVCYPWRYHPAMQDIRALTENGVLGRPIAIEARQITGQVGGPHGSDPASPTSRKDVWGGGNLQYVGCHILEGMRYLMGCEVKTVSAQIGRPLGYTEEEVEDIAVLALEYENGAMASLVAAYLSPKGVTGAGRSLTFYGSEGWANWPSIGGDTLEVYSASPQWSGTPEKTIKYTVAPLPSIVGAVYYYNWIENFVSDIRAGNKGTLNMTDALYVQQSIDAAYESGRTGQRVEVQYGL